MFEKKGDGRFKEEKPLVAASRSDRGSKFNVPIFS
jgi:hypothetical protein